MADKFDWGSAVTGMAFTLGDAVMWYVAPSVHQDPDSESTMHVFYNPDHNPGYNEWCVAAGDFKRAPEHDTHTTHTVEEVQQMVAVGQASVPVYADMTKEQLLDELQVHELHHNEHHQREEVLRQGIIRLQDTLSSIYTTLAGEASDDKQATAYAFAEGGQEIASDLLQQLTKGK